MALVWDCEVVQERKEKCDDGGRDSSQGKERRGCSTSELADRSGMTVCEQQIARFIQLRWVSDVGCWMFERTAREGKKRGQGVENAHPYFYFTLVCATTQIRSARHEGTRKREE